MNYRVKIATFQVVREPGQPARRQLSKPEAVLALARKLIPDDAREHFGCFYLDAQNRLVAYVEIGVGTLNACLVSPREVFGPAMRLMGVAHIICVHNHPSGDPTPSREDIRLTRQLKEASRIVDIALHDHIIIGNGTDAFVSFAGRGEL